MYTCLCILMRDDVQYSYATSRDDPPINLCQAVSPGSITSVRKVVVTCTIHWLVDRVVCLAH